MLNVGKIFHNDTRKVVMNYKKIKKRTFEILEKDTTEDVLSKRADIFIIVLIFINILAVILESVKYLQSRYKFLFDVIELISIAIFTVEYILRIWSITEKKHYQNPISGRLRYLFTFYSIIDLLSVIPAYIPIFVTADARVIRGLRLIRLFRILKLSRYNKAFGIIRDVILSKKEELVISLFAVLKLLVIASCLMYFIENKAQPEAFSSIPETMWWGVATLTTVGYGDVYPVTGLGKLMAGVMAILGVGLFALPAGILANGFSETLENKNNQSVCRHCGKKL